MLAEIWKGLKICISSRKAGKLKPEFFAESSLDRKPKPPSRTFPARPHAPAAEIHVVISPLRAPLRPPRPSGPCVGARPPVSLRALFGAVAGSPSRDFPEFPRSRRSGARPDFPERLFPRRVVFRAARVAGGFTVRVVVCAEVSVDWFVGGPMLWSCWWCRCW